MGMNGSGKKIVVREVALGASHLNYDVIILLFGNQDRGAAMFRAPFMF